MINCFSYLFNSRLDISIFNSSKLIVRIFRVLFNRMLFLKIRQICSLFGNNLLSDSTLTYEMQVSWNWSKDRGKTSRVFRSARRIVWRSSTSIRCRCIERIEDFGARSLGGNSHQHPSVLFTTRMRQSNDRVRDDGYGGQGGERERARALLARRKIRCMYTHTYIQRSFRSRLDARSKLEIYRWIPYPSFRTDRPDDQQNSPLRFLDRPDLATSPKNNTFRTHARTESPTFTQAAPFSPRLTPSNATWPYPERVNVTNVCPLHRRDRNIQPTPSLLPGDAIMSHSYFCYIINL